MSEITKLYKNAGVKKREQGYCDWDSDCPYDMDKDCGKTCPYWVEEEPDYPPFTPEKQLSLIKWFTHKNNRYEFRVLWNIKYYIMLVCETEYGHCEGTGKDKEFSECLAKLINNIWQDLTESEQEQIRSILNG